ncbi:helix-turn-helix transcriptional regulator [Listeria booriae]|uniref:Helix-turn-helix transcriptional regulator n=3 Tax=Listeria booriae TaxID=1552123 RepID=A0A7X0YN38_9LIST|nr:helix-turn-helix transcriptional regulator [Listeria booriae]MBC1552293.1 helix-turn-helix transcriptional regulator [Listeria booriae]MBC1802082.1 helix-turn-helix transcriptional regulator [Listeria booriae]MBC2022797.1 helix-turn-helix transcriptional regulator [Listeria booriae]MBC2047276.1 helix-turn-helix transcriptional regulator [Listeria booriae]MBC2056586.1 helix-turn-helix transcriptional regulator [Listeria booriae]
MNKKIATMVKEIRLKNKYSQDDMAKQVLGVSKRQVIRIESGKAELSLSQFLQVTTYFDLDIAKLLNQILDMGNVMAKINTLYSKAKDPTFNQSDLMQRIEELLENEEMNRYHVFRLELLQSLINYRETDDSTYLIYFTKHIDSSNADDIRLLNLSLSTMSSRQIVACIESLKKNDFTKKTEILNKILINSLGFLVKNKYNDATYIQQLFQRAKSYTLDNGEYSYLPILYFHMAMFNKRIGNKSEFLFCSERALFLAEIYENDVLKDNIKRELEE